MSRLVGGASAAAAASRATKNRQAVREALRVGQASGDDQPPVTSSPSAKRSSSRLSCGLAAEAPDRYLLRFGYVNTRDGKALPQLGINIDGHEEEDGHTYYMFSCTLRVTQAGGSGKFSSTTWSCRHRLCDVRETLHDAFKAALGQQGYEASFGETPFARHGGPPGTTARLKAWFGSLASCMNNGSLEPQVMVHVLRFLQAPPPEDGETRVRHADQAALRKAGRCMVCTVAIGPHEQEGLCVRCLVLQAEATRKAADQRQHQQQPQQKEHCTYSDSDHQDRQTAGFMPFFQGGGDSAEVSFEQAEV